jgi:DNA mismatch repair protein MutS
MISISSMLSYIKETQKGKMPKIQYPKRYISTSVLQIDTSTRKSLEIVKTLEGERKGSLISIIGKYY